MSDTRIELGDYFDGVERAWERALIAHGHRPSYEDGELNVCFLDIEDEHTGHNGPGCEACGYAKCMHCHPDPAKVDIPLCAHAIKTEDR